MKQSNCQRTHWIHTITIVAAVAFSALSTSTVSGFVPSGRTITPVKFSLHATADESELDNDIAGDHYWTRRETLTTTASSLLAASAAAAFSFPEDSRAADTAATRQEIISKLAGIPTFALVNGPGAGKEFDGVPFDIYNADSATATGYFFMSYDIALQALKAASELDSARGDGNIWATAKVKVVPLSIAIQLSLSKRRRLAINEEKGVGGIQVDTINNIIPSEDGNNDAQRLDTSRGKNAKKWETKGRVPLFYIPEPSIKKDLYYFDTNSLIQDYKRNHQANDPGMTFIPDIQVAELIDIFRKAQQTNDWEALRDFVETIQPSPEARQDAIKLLKEDAASKAAPYNFEKVYLVVAAK